MRSRSLRGAATLAACLTIFAPGTAPAETNSVPDGSAHPYVGQYVLDSQPDHPGLEGGCSGALISPTVFLTAAHCVYERPRVLAGPTYVTFDSRWDYPGTPSDLHLVKSIAWDPQYMPHGFVAPHDRAVMVLTAPVAGVTPARLPSEDLLGGLAAVGSWYDSVGYGSRASPAAAGRGNPSVTRTCVATRSGARLHRCSWRSRRRY